ncbi:inositol monophosphatase family protein [Primorskyibacter flagellatus]|uniref:Inositol-1-monophosphatase n=1 Tax=Primorskyibacter flagellatus TaxID=1387277 RepID=A0A1W2EIT0_9RHOB|nr:inositol monophosphatase family protein [Primorskyibacter flagellatus]SMD09078.1 myo-inositol-1(or 4)-monophosphatase [Primorskyibacter flagellatus]
MDQAAKPADKHIVERANLCLSLIQSAGRIALDGFRRRDTDEIAMKGSQDFLTETDAAVEEHLRAGIAAALPGDEFLGEETGGSVTGRSVWVVDPIDGTANFARRIPHFCISVAYVRDGITEIGAVFSPATDELWFARRGMGASCNGQPIHVAGTRTFAAACLELGWNNRRPQQEYLSVLNRLLDHGANVRRGASGALGLVYVADGRSDGYAELHMNAWDCLAGLLLVEEAGGRVSDLPEDGLSNGGAVLAVVPALAPEISASTGIPLASHSNSTDRARMIA